MRPLRALFPRRVARRTFARRVIGLFALGYALSCGVMLAGAADLRWLAAALGAGILAIPALSAGQIVARLHDRDRTGWWLALYAGLTALDLAPIDEAFDTYPISIGAYVLGTLAFEIWLLLDLFGRTGTPGPNRFGPAP